MTQLVSIHDNKVTTTSKIIAETFHKSHHHVCRDIEKLNIPMDFRAANFGLSNYKSVNRNGKILPQYEITRDGFVLLAMGFTGKRAMEFKLKYIAAFNEMESQLREDKSTTIPAYIVTRRHLEGAQKMILCGQPNAKEVLRYNNLGLSLGEIGKLLNLSAASIKYIEDRLTMAGFVVRKRKISSGLKKYNQQRHMLAVARHAV